ncbi:hypothetical protein [Sphingomonas sp. CROZ-RG-20F-R02-07]|uniref:hypothetical protein n=1 Tax=Sphingomonas sp. CROZ-RG-20F-R02-07 TaxID=2914832 RepID=UPI001F562368|nr:hypothetical protein [Sphingomonas sp. CROZ-RG-20F-R02-07]
MATTFEALDRTCAIVDQLAAKLAAADGLNWAEPCGYDGDGDCCDSDTCVAANYEDHDAEVGRAAYRRYARHALAFTGRVASRETEIAAARAADSDSQPDGTRDSLAMCALMLETYGPDCFPPDENGQLHFARCMMDATASEIRAFLAAPIGGQG